MSKKYKVELTTLAQEQILQIAEYIRYKLQAPDAAKYTVDCLETEISKLDTMPERIVLVDREPWHSRGGRKYVIGNYIAYFIIVQDEIVRVTAVCLGRGDQKKQLEQMKIETNSENSGINAMRKASRIAQERGISNMTLDEINAEIAETRK